MEFNKLSIAHEEDNPEWDTPLREGYHVDWACWSPLIWGNGVCIRTTATKGLIASGLKSGVFQSDVLKDCSTWNNPAPFSHPRTRPKAIPFI